MPEVLLTGCSPEPLAAYLKALGVLRLVAEQVDAAARGAWTAEGFELRSSLDANALGTFFLDRYAPTPIVAPWNGGSGFHPKDNKTGIDAIRASVAQRFSAYRTTVAACRSCLDALGITEKPSRDIKDRLLLPALRAEMPEAALAWFDAAVVLTEDGPSYPPLLGTGGNDGRLDFTNNHMRRITELFDASGSATPDAPRWLLDSLFGDAIAGLVKGPVGQYDPSKSGGNNNGPAFDSDSRVNPWSYVLMLEGALLFAAAATRKLASGDTGTLAYPFAVRQAGVGYGSAAAEDERASRCEMWLPLWSRHASLGELRSLFGEGRAKLGRRDAADGVDFARAIATLGIARGIDTFARYGFQVRNGLSYLATPLGRFPVRELPSGDLLAPLDRWLTRLRRAAADSLAPASVQRAERRLREVILEQVRGTDDGAVGRLLCALGGVEKALDRSLRFAVEKHLPPVPQLGAEWLAATDDGSCEFALAAALAAHGVRESLVRVRLARPRSWQEDDDRRTVWGERDLVRNLIAVLRRRELEGVDPSELGRAAPSVPARLADIAQFIAGDIDAPRLESWLRGLALVQFERHGYQPHRERSERLPPAAFAALSLVHDRRPLGDTPLPTTPGLLARGAAGDGLAAVGLAVRRLRGQGIVTRFTVAYEPPERTRRITAALAFPLSGRDRARLAAHVGVPPPSRVPDSA